MSRSTSVPRSRLRTIAVAFLSQGIRPDVAATFASQLMLLATGLVTGIVTARVLGPSGRGQLAVALLIPTALVLLVGLGSTISNVYFIGSGRLSVGEMTSNSAAFVLCGSAVAAILLIILHVTGGLGIVLPRLPLRYIAVAFVVLPLALLSNALNAAVRGLQLMRRAALVDALQGAASLMATLVALLVVHAAVLGAIVAAACGPAVSSLAAVYVLRPMGLSLRPRVRGNVSRQVLSFGLRGDLANLTQFFSYRLDSFLVNALVSSAALGIYSVATRLAELLWLLPGAVSTVVLSRATTRSASELNRTTPRLFGRTTALVLMGALVIAMLSGVAVPVLYGSAFSAATVPLLLLLPGVVMLGGATVLTNELAGRGHPGYNTINSITGLLVTIALDVVLIPRLGIRGAAIASTSAYGVNSVLAVAFFLRVSGMRLRELARGTRWWSK